MVFPTLASVVLSTIVCDTTLTVSVTPPSSSVTFCRTVESTTSGMFVVTEVLNPESSTFRS